MIKISSEKKVVTTVTDIYELQEGLRVSHKKANGKWKSPTFLGKGIHDSIPLVVTPEFWEYIKTKNPFTDYHPQSGPILDVTPKTMKEVQQAYQDGNVIFYGIMHHMVFNVAGRPIHLPQRFDYVSSAFTNQHLDLDRVLPYLKEHPWVLNKDSLRIQDVPYYNNDDGLTKFIEVVLLPDSRYYNDLYDRAMRANVKHFSSFMQDELACAPHTFDRSDALGLAPYRITKKGE